MDAEGKTVVLAEENAALREQLASRLRSDGYLVIDLNDGVELCDYLEQAHFGTGTVATPDVIISDMDLSGFGGAEICQMLSAWEADESQTPFILLATKDDADSWEHAEKAGASHVLDKPVDTDELLNAVAFFAEA